MKHKIGLVFIAIGAFIILVSLAQWLLHPELTEAEAFNRFVWIYVGGSFLGAVGVVLLGRY